METLHISTKCLTPKDKNKFYKLQNPKNMERQLEAYKIITDTAFGVIIGSKKEMSSNSYNEGKILFQTAVIKCLSIAKLCVVEDYQSVIAGVGLKNLSDPFSAFNLVRSQLEAYFTFNNIYINSNTESEKEFKHTLWIISGLKNRQKFDTDSVKKEQELVELDNLKSNITTNSFLTNATNCAVKAQILSGNLRDDKWNIITNKNNKLHFPNLTDYDLLEQAGYNTGFTHLYRLFCLYAHPSYVSIMQFKDYTENIPKMSKNALMFSQAIMSGFISDYCKVSQEAKKTFEELPHINQMLVNKDNLKFRGPSYIINDILKQSI